MQFFSSWSFLSMLLMLTSFMFGCSITVGDFIPQSRFVYPNSNVEPLGQVSVEVSKTTVFSPKVIDADFLKEIYDAALAQKGGDLLLNYKINTTVTQYPLILVNIFTTTIHLDGTAAKMTIGRKELR